MEDGAMNERNEDETMAGGAAQPAGVSAGQVSPSGAFQGAIDRGSNSARISGWAISPDSAAQGASVDIYIDDSFVASVNAGNERPDIEKEFGVRLCGFSYEIPADRLDGQPHSVAVKISGSEFLLKRSGLQREFPLPPAPEPQVSKFDNVDFQGSVNSASVNQIIGWAWDKNDPSGHVLVKLKTEHGLETGVVASNHRRDLEAASIGDGDHGFAIEIPASLKDGLPHVLDVVFENGEQVKKGSMVYGPHLQFPETTFRFDDEGEPVSPGAEEIRNTLYISKTDAFPPFTIELGGAVEISLSLPDCDVGDDIYLKILRIAGLRKDSTFLMHTFEQGLSKIDTLQLRKDPVSGRWKKSFRILTATNPKDIVGSPAAKGPLKVIVSLFRTRRPDAPVDASSQIALTLPVALKKMSPSIFSVLDMDRRSRETNHRDMVVLDSEYKMRGSHLPHTLTESFSTYIMPLVSGYVTDEMQEDFSCVSLFTALSSRDDGTLSMQRADALVIQAEKLLGDKIFNEADGAAIIRAIDLARINGSKTTFLLDSHCDYTDPRIRWAAERCDLIVDMSCIDRSGKTDRQPPRGELVAYKPFISPGRVNPFDSNQNKSELFEGIAKPKAVLDGFWDLLDVRDPATRADLDKVRAGLKVVDSHFRFSRYRAMDAGDFYWNVIGSITGKERSLINGDSDYSVLLPHSSVVASSRFRHLLETLAVWSMPLPVGTFDETHLYYNFLKLLLGDTIDRVRSESVLVKLALAARAMKAVMQDYNTVDVLDLVMPEHKRGLIEHNRKALKPKVSIVLATKRPHLVEDALRRLVQQTYENYEIIVVLHGVTCTDEQKAAFLAFDHVTFVEEISKDKTLGYCLNFAVGISTGEFIAKVDDDDIYSPHHISDFILYQQSRRIDLFARPLGFVYMAEEGTLLQQGSALNHSFQLYSRDRFPGFVGAGGTIIVRKAIAQRVGFSDTRRGGLDSDFITRALAEGLTLTMGDAYGFALCRYGAAGDHTWLVNDDSFSKRGRLVAENINLDDVADYVDCDPARWVD